MQSTYHNQPPGEGSSSSRSTASPTPKRHRVDSNAHALWSAAPEPKRVRSGDAALRGPTTTTTTGSSMSSAKVQGKRPEVIDLTTTRRAGGSMTAAFQPQNGARKLVIKNLRTEPNRASDAEDYYRQAWAELDAALTAVFAREQPRQPLERLYRNVENICRKGGAQGLYELLDKRFEDYLHRDVLRRIKADGGASNVEMLRSVHKYWKIWNQQSVVIRSTFSWLDRSYLLSSKTLPRINDMCIGQFRRMVFVTSKTFDSADTPLGAQVLAGMCELVDYDRRGDERFDSGLLRDSVTMLHIFAIYNKSFEPLFLKESIDYFEDLAEERSTGNNLKEYITACERLLKREDYRCNAYNFDSSTKRQLLDAAHSILIEKYSAKLLDGGSVAKLLDDHDVVSMKALYELLRLSGIQQRLREPWEAYIEKAGSIIVNDTSRGDEMVIRLLELRRSLDIIVRDAFDKDNVFAMGLRDAFGRFINDTKIASSWNTGTSKVGEMIAKYMDMLLRGGLKTLPKSLLSDSKDRADAEKRGQASAADDDAELDRQLDQAIELFRFIQGKDVFEAFYKKDLARRLLMGRSASQDAERNMLTKLKSECGGIFTHNLEQMFRDQELAKDEMASYKQWREGMGEAKSGVDLNVSILSAAAWPTYSEVRLLLPEDVADQIDRFDRYYKNKHTGRRLTWMHNLAHCVVKASFPKGQKELLVSAFQAVVLVLFNQVGRDGSLSYEQISQATGLTGGDLERTLQSLACGKTRVLAKHPKGKDVGKTDTFTVNAAFSDPKYRVKINQIQLKETREENQETHERVAADRQFETQAAIVRIMKSRKSMTHAQLVAEVINQTKSRGAVDASEIKANIEKLIEKDYLEREGGTYTYLA
ncbi:Cullin-domain-containing protein [Pleurostoma richardsiae]|uniref:Cullin-domain-containing protein n=1 Tax=Pleurostoma richardsiae TaxID=41990 RepID=A0AA38RXX7_9PEZI|nr:Cullin-domain-containing protein [Pleurostoma richardsiae]